MEKFDTDGDSKIDVNELNKGTKSIANEYQKRVKALGNNRKPLRKKTDSRRKQDSAIIERLKSLKKFQKTLDECALNPEKRGCVSYKNTGDKHPNIINVQWP